MPAPPPPGYVAAPPAPPTARACRIRRLVIVTVPALTVNTRPTKFASIVQGTPGVGEVPSMLMLVWIGGRDVVRTMFPPIVMSVSGLPLSAAAMIAARSCASVVTCAPATAGRHTKARARGRPGIDDTYPGRDRRRRHIMQASVEK